MNVLQEAGDVAPERVLRKSLELLAQIAVERNASRKADALLNRLEALPHAQPIDVAVSEGLRGDLFLSGGQLMQAESAYRKSISERELAGFGSALSIVPELDNLAILYLNEKRTSEALVLLRRAASITDVPKTDADVRVQTLGLLGVGLGRHKDAEEADLCFKHAIELLPEVPAGMRADIGRTVYTNYVAYLRATGAKKRR